jgi:hypothetical protein
MSNHSAEALYKILYYMQERSKIFLTCLGCMQLMFQIFKQENEEFPREYLKNSLMVVLQNRLGKLNNASIDVAPMTLTIMFQSQENLQKTWES